MIDSKKQLQCLTFIEFYYGIYLMCIIFVLILITHFFAGVGTVTQKTQVTQLPSHSL